ncbi:MAG TPA: MarR family transcriptional regulator [Pseudonocardiaceae bacterium]|nr:MarR family transcriptional regulator [Pseudonocardiaceae bacterium]
MPRGRQTQSAFQVEQAERTPSHRGRTLLQLTALYLLHARAPVSLTDLARALGTEPAAASALIDGLIGAGLVGRRADMRHRAHVVLTLTPTGEAILAGPGSDPATRLRAVFNDASAVCRTVLVC